MFCVFNKNVSARHSFKSTKSICLLENLLIKLISTLFYQVQLADILNYQTTNYRVVTECPAAASNVM